jgi:hypothetical protein
LYSQTAAKRLRKSFRYGPNSRGKGLFQRPENQLQKNRKFARLVADAMERAAELGGGLEFVFRSCAFYVT